MVGGHELLAAGSDAWRGVVSASKVAAMLGISPWQSPFALWHEMRGDVEPEPFDPQVGDFGHDAEHLLGKQWERRNPGWEVPWDVEDHEVAFTDESLPFPNQVLADFVATGPDGSERIVECKTTNHLDEWADEDGNPALPPYYWVQVLFQMGVSGIHAADVIVLGPFRNIEIFPVQWDEEAWRGLVDTCTDWWHSLETGKEPALDDTVATYKCVRKLHPDIEKGEEVEISEEEAVALLDAKHAADEADKHLKALTAKHLHEMGRAQKLTCNGTKIAGRQPGKGGSVQFRINQKADL